MASRLIKALALLGLAAAAGAQTPSVLFPGPSPLPPTAPASCVWGNPTGSPAVWQCIAFGQAVGDVPLWVNFNGSGHIGLVSPDTTAGPTFNLKRATTGPQDTADFFVHRNANYAGGSNAYVNNAINATTITTSGANSYEWAASFILDNFNTFADASQNVAEAAHATQEAGGLTWARNGSVVCTQQDQTGGCVGDELDEYVNGTQANNNRVIFHLVGGNNSGGHDYSANGPGHIRAGILLTPQNNDATTLAIDDAWIIAQGDYPLGMHFSGAPTANSTLLTDDRTGPNVTYGLNLGGTYTSAAIFLRDNKNILWSSDQHVKTRYVSADSCLETNNQNTILWSVCNDGHLAIGSTGWLTFPSISAPSLPSSGGFTYVDSNGALHYASQWYDTTLPGGKFSGDSTRPWYTTPIGFGNIVTGSGNNRPNIRIQKSNSSALASAALSTLDTVGTNQTAQETSVIFNTICSAGVAYDGLPCVGLQVEVDRNAGQYGTPFAANFVAKTLNGDTQANVGTETDVVTSNPDPSANLVRVISDNLCREGVAQTGGQTTCGYGVRARPSDNQGSTTGPVQLVNAFQAFTGSSYPGASIGNAFSSDGGATNGVNLASKSVTATTNATGTSGTNTLTFAIANIPAAAPGAWISDGGEGFIPANTTITAVSTTAGVTTVTMSNNTTGNVANGQAITITQAFGTGVLLNGKFNTAARSTTSQYGLEETLINGLALGSATGGAQGRGTVNITNEYINGIVYSFDVRSYGAKCDGSTDDAAAWNSAITAAKAAANVSGTPMTAKIRGCTAQSMIKSTLNFSGINSPVPTAFVVDMSGGCLLGETNGTPVIDAMGSKYIRWEHLCIKGMSTLTPNVGIQWGRVSTGVPADQFYWDHPVVEGFFTFAAAYNQASEDNTFIAPRFTNATTSGTNYGLVMDGYAYWTTSPNNKITSSNQTLTTSVTAYSFIGETFIGGNIVSNNTTSAGAPIWMGQTSQHHYMGTYVNSSGVYDVVLYCGTAASGGVNKNASFDIHAEGSSVTNTFFLTGAQTTKCFLYNFAYSDNQNFASASVFAIDGSAGFTTAEFDNADIKIDTLFATPNVFDTAANYSLSGKVYLPTSTPWNVPTGAGGFSGTLCYNNRCDSYSNPTGLQNQAVGDGALASSSLSGNFDTAFGKSVLNGTGTGGNNSGFGYAALTSDTSGAQNTATGSTAGQFVSTGTGNTFNGYAAGTGITGTKTTGNNNTGVGASALNALQGAGNNNTAIGKSACATVTTGTNDICIGSGADVASGGTSNEIHINNGSGDILSCTGGGTPSTSKCTFAGQLTVTSQPGPYTLYRWGVPIILTASGFFQNNGVYIIGQAPSNSATLSVSATSGSVTATFSAATLLGTAADVGRIITICDANCTTTTASSYEYCTITAQSSTTVATCTLSTTLSGTGAFANNKLWLSGTPTTNTTAFSVPLINNAACSSTVGCYMYFPAGAIVAAGSAAMYYAQCVSTTVCTVFNNTLASGNLPVKIASPTAFSTTGPGAFTQTSNSSLTMMTIPVAGNLVGANGSIDFDTKGDRPSNADSVTEQMQFGGQALGQGSGTSLGWYGLHRTLMNLGVTNSQVTVANSGNVATDQAVINSNPAFLSVDTTISRNFVINGNLVTGGTDWLIVYGGSIVINYAP